MSAFTRAENCPRQPLNARALIANLATLAAQRLLRIDSCASGRSPLRGPAETVAPGAWLSGQLTPRPGSYTFLTMRCSAGCLGRTVTSPDLQRGPVNALTGSVQLAGASVTQRLVAAGTMFGCQPALVARRPERSYSFAGLASTAQHAAAGLAWRWLRPRDVVGVYYLTRRAMYSPVIRSARLAASGPPG